MGLFSPGAGVFAGLIAGSPGYAKLEKLNLADEQTKAINANEASLPQLEKIASGVNQFNYDQLQSMLRSSIPNYDELKQTGSDQILKMERGELPLSDMQSSQLSSVAKAFGGGFAGAGAMGNLVARDLGLKTLDVINKGLSSAESWMRNIAAMEKPDLFDFSSMFISPMQQYQTANEQNIQHWQWKQGRNLQEWQHSLGYLVGNEINQDSAQLDSLVSSVAGNVAGKALGGMV